MPTGAACRCSQPCSSMAPLALTRQAVARAAALHLHRTCRSGLPPGLATSACPATLASRVKRSALGRCWSKECWSLAPKGVVPEMAIAREQLRIASIPNTSRRPRRRGSGSVTPLLVLMVMCSWQCHLMLRQRSTSVRVLRRVRRRRSADVGGEGHNRRARGTEGLWLRRAQICHASGE